MYTVYVEIEALISGFVSVGAFHGRRDHIDRRIMLKISCFLYFFTHIYVCGFD